LENNPLSILLTNDDSRDSPLFSLAVESFSKIGNITIAVPAAEQSWKGKSMTRKGTLHVEDIEISGHSGWSISGTPADCTNLAIHQLMDNPPDIVVSGINIGKNIGAGFVFASGTVGACLEGNIAGIPGLALSQELTKEDFFFWDRNRQFSSETTTSLTNSIRNLVPKVWEELIEANLDFKTTWNVNFPLSKFESPEIIKTKLSNTFYGNCFRKTGDAWEFALADARIDNSPGTDNVVITSGHISATLLDLTKIGT
jgi:5'-nucleotidase